MLGPLGDLDDTRTQIRCVEQLLDRGVVAFLPGWLLDRGDQAQAGAVVGLRSQLVEEILPVRESLQSSDRTDGGFGHRSSPHC